MKTQQTDQPEASPRALLAALGFLAILGGQFALYLAPEGSSRGVMFGLALTLLGMPVLLSSLLFRPPAFAARLRLSSRMILVLLSVLMAVMASLLEVLFERYGRTNYLPVLLVWVAAGLAYLIASVDSWPTGAVVRAWVQDHRRELVGLALIVLLAVALRFYRLGTVPRVIDGDEGQVGAAALNTQQVPLANPFALWANFGGLYLQTIYLALYTLGTTPLALRLVPAVLGSLAIPATFVLGRALAGARAGWLAALLLAISHTHVHFSRIVSVAYIAETLLIPLELYFFYTGLRARQVWRMAVGGMILGLHFSVYLSSQITVALLVVYLLLAVLVARPAVRGPGRVILAFWLGVLITGLPQGVYTFRHPSEFLARLNSDGTFQSGWLASEIATRGQSAVQILAGRVVHAFLTLNHLPAVDFYGARIPLLDLLTGALFLVGLLYCLWRTRDGGLLLLNGYFWSLMLAIAIFAIPPSADSYRMLVALPAAIIMAAVGLDVTLTGLRLDGPERRVPRLAFAGCLLAASLLLNARAYFVDFAARCRYGGDRATRFASYLGNYLKTVDPETVVYLLSDNELRYGTHGSVDFLSGGTLVANWDDPVAGLAVNANTIVLAGPPRHDELRAWARQQATGDITHITDCDQPMLLVYTASAAP